MKDMSRINSINRIDQKNSHLGELLFKWLIYILLWIVSLWMILPLLWMFNASLRTGSDLFQNPYQFIPLVPTLENYIYVIEKLPFWTYVWNTMAMTGIVTFFKLVTSVLAAYAFSFFQFRGSNILFYLLLLTSFIPFTATMIPNYLIIAKAGLLSTIVGVALPQLADGLGIFLMRQAFLSVPYSLYEAARLDRISPLKTLWYILLPVVRPSLLALGIVFWINTWNEYFWPFLVLKEKTSYTLPVALQMFTNLEGGTNWGAMMAAASLTSIVPLVVFFIAQREIMQTFLSSGIKG